MRTSSPALIIAAASLLAAAPAAAQAPASLDQLLEQARNYRQRVAEESKVREQRFLAARNEQRALLQQVQRELTAEEQRSEALKKQFDQNEVALSELEETLRIRIGDMGELFGVVRQVAGDANGVLNSSLVTAQYPDRAGGLVQRLAEAKELPSIGDLDELRLLLMEEMVQSGKVVKFPSEVLTAEGEPAQANVVRVGVFNLISGDKFLRYEESNRTIQELPRQPAGRFRTLAAGLFEADGGVQPMAVDPTYGGLLGLLIQAPSLQERVNQGGIVGYVIIALGIIGLLIALERLATLFVSGAKIRSQLNKPESPSASNPLGRILNVYHENKDADTETLELKLDEAILKETPRLEKRQNAIKVLAAVAPLLGLLGTVTGMIETFQSITLFGTGDPKLMAGGISEALVTTLLGLTVAIPLVLLHSLVSGRSRGQIEVLEEQSAGMIAAQSEKLQ